MSSTFEPFDNDHWIVCLTTCVNTTVSASHSDDRKQRLDLYVQQITQWLTKTQLPLVVVENSNTDFLLESPQLAELVTSLPRERFVRFYHFQPKDKYGTSTAGETHSLKYAMAKLKEEAMIFQYMLKVTGRYYLENIESVLQDIKEKEPKDVYLQIHRKPDKQNSEYFAMKWELWDLFLESVGDRLMEEALFTFSSKYTYETFGPFPNTIARGGDGAVFKELFTRKANA